MIFCIFLIFAAAAVGESNVNKQLTNATGIDKFPTGANTTRLEVATTAIIKCLETLFPDKQDTEAKFANLESALAGANTTWLEVATTAIIKHLETLFSDKQDTEAKFADLESALGAATCLHGYQVQNHWALLVAGSNGYHNYRHQADVAHAYQVVRKYGIPESNIVTMMYDDIAYHRRNPYKGTLINQPGGPNVYQGLVKDYVGTDVTPANFLKILSGDKQGMRGIGSGKVIASGPNDHIFVFFADHGSPGIIVFPTAVLHVGDLNRTIRRMYQDRKYGKMVMYVEACESGSMFDSSLPYNIDVMALTAANGSTSSYACYYDQSRGVFLGDLFSVSWMEDSDRSPVNVETLMEQFLRVKKRVTTSQVCMFGDADIARNYRVAEFQGGMTTIRRPPTLPLAKLPVSPSAASDAVPAPDVPLYVALKKLEAAKTEEEKENALKEYEKIKNMRKFVDLLFDNVVDEIVKDETFSKQYILTDKAPLRQDAEACYQSVVDAFHANCFNLGQNEYPLRKLQVFINLCESNVPESRITAILKRTCVLGPWDDAE